MNFKKFILKIICYYFNDIIKSDFDIDKISIDEKSHKNILIYNILYKTLIGPKPLHSKFNKIDGFIWIYDGTRYSTLFASEKYSIYNKVRNLANLKSSITYVFSRFYTKIKVDSFHFLPEEKRLTLHNVITLIKSFFLRIKIPTL